VVNGLNNTKVARLCGCNKV